MHRVLCEFGMRLAVQTWRSAEQPLGSRWTMPLTMAARFASEATPQQQQQQQQGAGQQPAQPSDSQPSTSGSQPSTSGSKREEWYSTTPHIMDANSNEPLKSSEYASSHDDKFGIQKNWFTSLYKQLNFFAKAGTVPELKGRQKAVFEAVEREFEGLYDRHIKSSGLTGMEHRAMLMVCLSVATYRILSNEIPDPKLVRDVLRTNQGSLMMGLLLPLHRFRIWILRYLLAVEPYKQAVQFLPALQADMGSLCTSELLYGVDNPVTSDAGSASAAQPAGVGGGRRGASALPDEVSLVIKKCRYHDVLTKEDAPHLLSDFCCNHGLVWLNEFNAHGVDVTLERSLMWEDECCSIRIARRRSS